MSHNLGHLGKLYPFLSHIKSIPNATYDDIAAKIANWNVIGQHLQSMTLLEIEQAMAIELDNRQRLNILSRLNARRSKLVAKQQEQSLVSVVIRNVTSKRP